MAEEPRCSFCNKSGDEAKKLISSPADYKPRSYICDECVLVCYEILEKSGIFKTMFFGIKRERIARMEKMGFSPKDIGECPSLVNFLESLRQRVDFWMPRVIAEEKTELGQEVARLRTEVRDNERAVEGKKKELADLEKKLAKLTPAQAESSRT
jgi:DNA-binding transcriptional MerR regulator